MCVTACWWSKRIHKFCYVNRMQTHIPCYCDRQFMNKFKTVSLPAGGLCTYNLICIDEKLLKINGLYSGQRKIWTAFATSVFSHFTFTLFANDCINADSYLFLFQDITGWHQCKGSQIRGFDEPNCEVSFLSSTIKEIQN